MLSLLQPSNVDYVPPQLLSRTLELILQLRLETLRVVEFSLQNSGLSFGASCPLLSASVFLNRSFQPCDFLMPSLKLVTQLIVGRISHGELHTKLRQ